MARKDEHREPINQRKKINLNPTRSETAEGLIGRYDQVDRNRTDELAKPEHEQDIARIERATEILSRLDKTLHGMGYDAKAEVRKLRQRKAR